MIGALLRIALCAVGSVVTAALVAFAAGLIGTTFAGCGNECGDDGGIIIFLEWAVWPFLITLPVLLLASFVWLAMRDG